MDLKELKTLHDKAYNAGQVPREQASDDLVFYWVTQWDDQLLNDSQLQYRGEFNVIRKAGRQIMADLRLNPIQPDFKPKAETREDDAELMDGIYRATDRQLSSQEAYDYASQDAVVCGFGAWELYTEYETNQVGDMNQVIKRRYIPEANNTVFFDPNAVALDKSDARHASVLFRYSEDGYKELYEELTGDKLEGVNWDSFAQPEESYAFPWVSEMNKVYVAKLYCRKKVKDTVITFIDPVGMEVVYLKSQLLANDILDDLIDEGYEVEAEKEIERWEVTQYICSGSEILDERVIAGENIPVIPVYGERAFIEGEEYYEGITRLAKDPQRLRNFQMSYLADIVSRSPRPKPIFLAEQVQGFEPMYEENGADNNYPYLLQNRLDADGNELPLGVAGMMPEQPIPSALAAGIQLTREAVDDVANAGLPQDIADPDLSGKAVIALQNRMDQQSYIYQHNYKFAKRRDAEVFAGMAKVVFDTPRTVMMETPDGNTKQVQIMDVAIDKESGEPVVLNDLTNMDFDVFAEIGQQYSTQKMQTREEIVEMMAALPDGDPVKRILLMKALQLSDGVNFDDVRDYARKELLMMGVVEPETEEEMAMMQAQSQQSQQPDAGTLLAMAEMQKAEAEIMQQQREAVKDAADIQNEIAKRDIDQQKIVNDRAKIMVDAEKANAEIDFTNTKSAGVQIDNATKLKDNFNPFRAQVNS